MYEVAIEFDDDDVVIKWENFNLSRDKSQETNSTSKS
jgi:hypothetical protein